MIENFDHDHSIDPAMEENMRLDAEPFYPKKVIEDPSEYLGRESVIKALSTLREKDETVDLIKMILD